MLRQEIEISGAFPESATLEGDLDSPELHEVIGQAIADVLVAHCEELDAERGHGFGVSGFYEGAARSTGFTQERGFPEVVVMQTGVAQRSHGGTIRARNVEYLAIPNSFSETIAATYSHSPREFGNLEVVFGRQKDTGAIGPVGLKAASDEEGAEMPHGTSRQRRLLREQADFDDVLFWLKREVWQSPDPTVLPADAELEDAGYRAAVAYLAHRTPTNITFS